MRRPGDRHQQPADFPPAALAPYGIDAQPADEFLLHLVGVDPVVVATTLQRQADALINPTQTLEDPLDRLYRVGLSRTVTALRLHLDPSPSSAGRHS